jgi:hypothetical protein
MIDPVSLSRLGQIRHQEMIQSAETARQRRWSQANQAGHTGHLLAQVGAILIAAGQKLGAVSRSEVEVPA